MSALRFALAGAALLASVGYAAAQSSDPYLAQTMTTAAGFCPLGWEDMNGQLLPIAQNQALFSLLGTTYGGDGDVTFALPSAKPLFTANGIPLRQCIAVQGVFPPED
jgi:microcystin-dependent protein